MFVFVSVSTKVGFACFLMRTRVAAVKVCGIAIHAALAHACVCTSKFGLGIADILLGPAQEVPSRLPSVDTLELRFWIP